MRYTIEQKIQNSVRFYGQEALKEMFNIHRNREVKIKTTLMFHFTPVKIAKIKKSCECTCWWGCEAKENTPFMLRSLIHLYLNVIQGDRYGTICILLHTDIQLDQNHLLKMLSFFPLYIYWHLCQRSSVCKSVVYFWVFNSIPLINMSVSVPVPCSF